jgi:hypothetical protein
MMSEYTRVRNEHIQEKAEVALVMDMIETLHLQFISQNKHNVCIDNPLKLL